MKIRTSLAQAEILHTVIGRILNPLSPNPWRKSMNQGIKNSLKATNRNVQFGIEQIGGWWWRPSDPIWFRISTRGLKHLCSLLDLFVRKNSKAKRFFFEGDYSLDKRQYPSLMKAREILRESTTDKA